MPNDTNVETYQLSYSSVITFTGNEEVVQNLSLEKIIIDPINGITGVVIDDKGCPVCDATVKLFTLDFSPIKHTLTDECGNYIITDVPQGEYLVYAVKNNYFLSTKYQCKIKNSIEKLDNITLTPYANNQTGVVYGKIFNFNKAQSEVKVKIYNKDDLSISYSTTSTDDGEYIIYGVPQGIYTLQASNKYQNLSLQYTVNIDSDAPVKQDIYLNKIDNFTAGTINGVISNCQKSKAEGAFVGLYKLENEQEILTAGTLTNREGKYFFGNVPKGNYIVKPKLN